MRESVCVCVCVCVKATLIRINGAGAMVSNGFGVATPLTPRGGLLMIYSRHLIKRTFNSCYNGR